MEVSFDTFMEHERDNEREIDDLKYRAKQLEEQVKKLEEQIEKLIQIVKNK